MLRLFTAMKIPVIALACLPTVAVIFHHPPAVAAGFMEDSSLTGGIYGWQRHRERKEQTGDRPGKYRQNLHHTTFNGSLDFSSGYAAELIGLDLGAYNVVELSNKGPAAPNEIGFSDARSRWDEKWTGDKNGVTIYKAAVKLKYRDYWFHGGYLQPSGQSLLAPHWSFLPGTYRGLEAGMAYKIPNAGELSFSWMWADKYKAPWYQSLYAFRKADGLTSINALHSLGAKYAFNNDFVLEGAFGQAVGYIDQYFSKVSYAFPLGEDKLHTSWQVYAAQDKETGGGANANDVYDGLAWLQAVTFGYAPGPFELRLEGTWVKAEGNQGFFLQRMTPGYATSNGRLDIWWDSRSDFNANGEKALFMGVMYDLKNWRLPGWAIGASYAWGWDARPSTNPLYDQGRRLKESAWNLDLRYTVQQGIFKDASVKLHYTRYNNHSSLPSWSGGYGNVFQDEKDIKFIVMAPFTLF